MVPTGLIFQALNEMIDNRRLPRRASPGRGGPGRRAQLRVEPPGGHQAASACLAGRTRVEPPRPARSVGQGQCLCSSHAASSTTSDHGAQVVHRDVAAQRLSGRRVRLHRDHPRRPRGEAQRPVTHVRADVQEHAALGSRPSSTGAKPGLVVTPADPVARARAAVNPQQPVRLPHRGGPHRRARTSPGPRASPPARPRTSPAPASSTHPSTTSASSLRDRAAYGLRPHRLIAGLLIRLLVGVAMHLSGGQRPPPGLSCHVSSRLPPERTAPASPSRRHDHRRAARRASTMRMRNRRSSRQDIGAGERQRRGRFAALRYWKPVLAKFGGVLEAKRADLAKSGPRPVRPATVREADGCCGLTPRPGHGRRDRLA